MKKIFNMCIVSMMTLSLIACGSSKQVSQSSATQNNGGLFGKTVAPPCEIYDTPTEFAATGIYRGSAKQLGDLQKHALENAQDIIRMKMKYAFKGAVSEFSKTWGNNKGNDLERMVTAAGDRIIDVIVNETSQSCMRYDDEVASDGHINCYVAITISKEEVSRRIAQEVEDKLSQEDRDRIGFDEEQYRKKMEELFQRYKEEQK